MKKGKFGIILCFYPIAAFAAVILRAPAVCLAIAGAAVFLEKDEWAGRQCLQACMASGVIYFFSHIVNLLPGIIPIPFIANLLTAVLSVLSALVYLAAAVFSVLGIIRVRKEEEANVPLLSELSYRIYGQRKPKPVAPPVPQYPMAYGVPQQPYPPQTGFSGTPGAAPQYAPPMAVQPAQPVQPPFEGPQPPQQEAQPYQQPQEPGQGGPTP